MTYALSSALQQAVYQHLLNDSVLAGLVGTAIYDALPSGTLPLLYVSIGPEKVRNISDKLSQSAEHEFIVSVVTDNTGFSGAKTVAGAICDVLVDAPLVLTRGTLTALHFYRAEATRGGSGGQRQIDLKFKARVSDQ